MLLSVDASAYQTEETSITFDGNTYAYRFAVVLDAPFSAVAGVVSDHAGLIRINDSITESRVLEQFSASSLKRLVRLRQCVIGFCFKLVFVELVEQDGADFHAVIVPAESTFLDGVADWTLEMLSDTRTRLTLSARQTPDFWIPPVIGPFILKRVFDAEVHETCANIEHFAQSAGTDS